MFTGECRKETARWLRLEIIVNVYIKNMSAGLHLKSETTAVNTQDLKWKQKVKVTSFNFKQINVNKNPNYGYTFYNTETIKIHY